MYIQPNGTIKLLYGIKLDNTYHDTILFEDSASQLAYFTGKVFKTFTSQTYTRRSRNSVRVEANADELFNCNYLMFNNYRYGGKWFYAFITSIDYVNEGCCDVNFEIDVMQTWAFDYTMDACYVEREHSADDAIGEYMASEPVDFGEVICTNMVGTGYFSEYKVCMARAVAAE